MKHRRFNRWLIWLLPFLAVRALIPAGFMLSAENGALQVVLCSGNGPVAVTQSVAPSAQAHHHLPAAQEQALRHDDGNAEPHRHLGSGAHENAVCPFALAAMAYLPGTAGGLLLAFAAPATIPDYSSQGIRFADLIQIHRIRGPPLA